MAVGTATALSLAGTAASALGGSKGNKGAAPAVQGFDALPKAVQDAWLKTYLPQAMNAAQLPYQAVPMQRAANPANDPFASQALWDLQQYSDQMGGYFTPLGAGVGGQAGAAGTQQGAAGGMAALAGGGGGDPRTAHMANMYLDALSPKLGGGPGSGNNYDLVMKAMGEDPNKLNALGSALQSQNYNPATGSRGVDLNAILAALGGK